MIQINIINKYKRISRRMLRPEHFIETLEKNVRKRTLELETNERRES